MGLSYLYNKITGKNFTIGPKKLYCRIQYVGNSKKNVNFADEMKRLPLLFISLLLICCCCGQIAENTRVEREEPRVDTLLLSDGMRAVFADSILPPSNPSASLPAPNDELLAEFFNDSNYRQYAAAEQMGIEPISDLSRLYNTRRPLVEIGTNDHYFVAPLTHSMPYLVPEAARLLDEIGEEFIEKTKKEGRGEEYKIVVTSVLRTPATVKKLKQINTNAVDSSTHMFATTFDLSYNSFVTPQGGASLSAGRLKMILAEVLKNKREDGRCFVKYEKQSPCFHITVTK